MTVDPSLRVATRPARRRKASCCERCDASMPTSGCRSPTLCSPPTSTSKIRTRAGCPSALNRSALISLNGRAESGSSESMDRTIDNSIRCAIHHLGDEPSAKVAEAPSAEPGLSSSCTGRTAVREAGTAAGRRVAPVSAAGDAAVVHRSLAVQSVGLAALGSILLAATLAAALQVLSRRFDVPLADLPVLEAMGLRTRQRVGLGALLAAPAAVGGALVAVAVTILASPLVPTGFARSVDPVQGFQVDGTVTAALTIALVLIMVGAG